VTFKIKDDVSKEKLHELMHLHKSHHQYSILFYLQLQ